LTERAMSDSTVEVAPIPYPYYGYIDRYCAFIDILGFRDLVRHLGGVGLQFETLRSLLTKIHSPVNPATKSWHIDFRAQSISDAVAISTIANDTDLLHLFIAIENLAVELLKEGYLIRGALVKGKLYHDDKMVFDDALIRAYELERTIVRFPRVMIARDVMQDIDQFCSGFLSDRRVIYESHIAQGDDGPYYVHVLRKIAGTIAKLQIENINLPPEKRHSLEEFASIQAVIQRRLDESTDNPRHFEKVQWFARYWNQHVPYGVTKFTPIIGPGMDIVTWRNSIPQSDGPL
jgi:hypothetical protein